MNRLKTIEHRVDLCVVGGGMSGWASAISAARHGVTVAIMQDRPMFGGNASSECRVHITGADRANQIPHLRETGLLEELRMLNLHRNPQSNFTVWDTLLHEMILNEPNISMLLNTSCLDAAMDNDRIVSVTGWQMTTQQYHTVRARWFADCSGDGILAPLTGAAFRMGREARAEFGESLAPETADDKTMGHSIRYHLRRHDTPQSFIPPPWAYRYDSCDDIPGGHGGNMIGTGYWWIELGGEHNTIEDSETLRDELLKIAYGVWDHFKNRCHRSRQATAHLALDWMNFVLASRESRRFEGATMLTQNDLANGGKFEDIVAYGGWTMDDHSPRGFYAKAKGEPSTHFHQCPSPYGIPYRALYARDIANLFFAGRNISATHMAMSSTRVMGTCMVMAQAVGTAVGLMLEKGLETPDKVSGCMPELQQRLLQDDCYLPGVPLKINELTQHAVLSASVGDPEPVRNGWSRQIGEETNAWPAGPDQWIAYEFDAPRHVEEVSLAFDTDMHLEVQMSGSMHCIGRFLTDLPPSLAQHFVIELKSDGQWLPHVEERANIYRHRRVKIGRTCEGVRLRILRFHGPVEQARLYTFVLR